MSTLPPANPYAGLYGVGSVSRYLPEGYVGSLLDTNVSNSLDSLVNKYPQAKQIWDVSITTATNGATYTLNVGGTPFAYVATSGTASVIATGMAAAFNQNTAVTGMFTASASTSHVILTAKTVGNDVTVSTADSKMSVSQTTSPAYASPVPFGDVVIPVGGQDANGTPFGTTVSSALFTAQVADATITYAAGENYTFTLSLYGDTYSTGPIAANTNSNTTATDIRAALTAAFAGLPVTVSGATNHAIVTANLAGIGFSLTIATTTGGNVTATGTVSSAANDFNKASPGVATLSYNQPSSTVGVAGSQYVPNVAMSVARNGIGVRVASAQTVSATDSVYVELAPGSNSGLCYNDSSSTRVKWVGTKWAPKPSNAPSGYYVNGLIPA